MRNDTFAWVVIAIFVGILTLIFVGIIRNGPNSNSESRINCKEIEEHDSFYVDNGQGYLVENCRDKR